NCFCFFFFQAEDGIRDSSVTGVQTCALPISHLEPELAAGALASRLLRTSLGAAVCAPLAVDEPVIALLWLSPKRGDEAWTDEDRSEERRVGKEWRSRWWAGQ